MALVSTKKPNESGASVTGVLLVTVTGVNAGSWPLSLACRGVPFRSTVVLAMSPLGAVR